MRGKEVKVKLKDELKTSAGKRTFIYDIEQYFVVSRATEKVAIGKELPQSKNALFFRRTLVCLMTDAGEFPRRAL